MDWIWSMRERENDSTVGWMGLTETEKVSGLGKTRNLALGMFSSRRLVDL